MCSECVPAFPGTDILRRFLPRFGVSSIVFGPDNLGLPNSRDRRYSTALNDETTKPLMTLEHFLDAARRSVVLSGQDFLRASPDQVNAFVDRIAQARKIPP